MNITEIPFVEKVGITRNSNGLLELSFSESVYNHLRTIHASAQFTLAETASGDFLQSLFPQLVDKVIPIVRDSHIKFKKPAVKSIVAHASISSEALQAFNDIFPKKGRASISVNVEVRDFEGTVTCIGTFNWFIQRSDETQLVQTP